MALARKGLAELAKFDAAKLTEAQRVSADVMRAQLELAAEEGKYLDFEFPLQQMNGANINLVEAMTVRHPLANEKDAVNYIAALGQVGMRMDEWTTAEARKLGAKNIIPPKFILRATVKQMQSFADPAPASNPFVTAFAQKMEAAKIPDARRAELQAQAEKIVATQIYPAWKRGIALLESQLPRSNDDAGLWRLKGGPAAYAYFLRRYTTTDLTAEQIHEIGLKEVARIEAEMDAILRKLGRTEGSVKDRVEKLKLDLAYPQTEAGRDLDHERCRKHFARRAEAVGGVVRSNAEIAGGRAAVSAFSRSQRRGELQCSGAGWVAARSGADSRCVRSA